MFIKYRLVNVSVLRNEVIRVTIHDDDFVADINVHFRDYHDFHEDIILHIMNFYNSKNLPVAVNVFKLMMFMETSFDYDGFSIDEMINYVAGHDKNFARLIDDFNKYMVLI